MKWTELLSSRNLINTLNSITIYQFNIFIIIIIIIIK
jgi:hypothetical protein